MLKLTGMAQNGHYFIDRDSRHFHDILNFLRVRELKLKLLLLRISSEIRCCMRAASVTQDGHFNYPLESTDYRYLLELRAESEYFGLVKLTEAIDAYPVSYLSLQKQ